MAANLPKHRWRRKTMKLRKPTSTTASFLFKRPWLLSLILFLSYYFITTATFTTITTVPLIRPATSTALLALESPPPDELAGVDLKVYVYELPPAYNADWLAHERCASHLFAAEVAIHRALAGSGRFRTWNPAEADFFFVPVYVSCNFSSATGFPDLSHARRLLQSAVRRVSVQLPYWNRSSGADHVFVASHDYGACFHTMEDAARADGIPSFMKNSIILQTFGVEGRHPCQEAEHIVIPPYVPPESITATMERSPAGRERGIWAYFRGKMEVHPKNVSGHFYSRRVRTTIWTRFKRNRRFHLHRHRFANYQTEIARSVFCLCPLGWAPWSPRLVESVALGCIPVIIADGIRLPFSDVVHWPAISISIPERQVRRLDRILHRVASTNLSVIQRNLRDPIVRQSLMFNQEIRIGDATWRILVGLSKKLNRSFRRRDVSTWKRVSGQSLTIGPRVSWRSETSIIV